MKSTTNANKTIVLEIHGFIENELILSFIAFYSFFLPALLTTFKQDDRWRCIANKLFSHEITLAIVIRFKTFCISKTYFNLKLNFHVHISN